MSMGGRAGAWVEGLPLAVRACGTVPVCAAAASLVDYTYREPGGMLFRADRGQGALPASVSVAD